MTLITSLTGLATCLVLVPYAIPDIFPWLVVIRIGFGIFTLAQFTTPQVNDLVKSEYRGRALALNGYGFVLGELFAYGVLYNFTKQLDPFTSFPIAFLFILFLIAIYSKMIKEPRPQMTLEPAAPKVPLLQLFVGNMRKVIDAAKNNNSLLLCLFGNLIIRLSVVLSSTFMLLWITSFVDSGVVESDDEAKTIY